jgi:hypothetical protein
MTSEASHLSFPRQIWQAVSDHARKCLLRREFCPEHSKIENLRCVHYREELDLCYGRQLWYFEAIGVDPVGRRHMLYGALDFSIQYGMMEASQAALFEDPEHRQRFFYAATHASREAVWHQPYTRFWVRMAGAGVVVLSLLWCLIFIKSFIQ